uniref:Uncharacterized protein n=1 Tax=Timema bartmani TaxID=61472 RepID=A0A7R9EPA5_9NEOP|nr:unnamed protein product [Timema bartmani]
MYTGLGFELHFLILGSLIYFQSDALSQPFTSVGYAEWMPNEPNDASGNEDCVHIYKIKLQLNDTDESVNMRGPAVLLLVFALVCVHTPSGTSGSTCVTPKSSSMGIAVVSRRNETGHWTAQLNFTHDSDGEKGREKGSGPWLVNFDQTVSVCEEGESVLIVATITCEYLLVTTTTYD